MEQLTKLLNQLFCLLKPYFSERKITWTTMPINGSGTVQPKSNYGVAFVNKGDVNATINGFPLNPGDPMLSLGVEKGERDQTKYKIAFEEGDPGDVKQIWIFYKELS